MSCWLTPSTIFPPGCTFSRWAAVCVASWYSSTLIFGCLMVSSFTYLQPKWHTEYPGQHITMVMYFIPVRPVSVLMPSLTFLIHVHYICWSCFIFVLVLLSVAHFLYSVSYNSTSTHHVILTLNVLTSFGNSTGEILLCCMWCNFHFLLFSHVCDAFNTIIFLHLLFFFCCSFRNYGYRFHSISHFMIVMWGQWVHKVFSLQLLASAIFFKDRWKKIKML